MMVNYHRKKVGLKLPAEKLKPAFLSIVPKWHFYTVSLG